MDNFCIKCGKRLEGGLPCSCEVGAADNKQVESAPIQLNKNTVMEPQVTTPQMAQPQAAQPQMAQPQTAQPQTTRPQTTRPQVVPQQPAPQQGSQQPHMTPSQINEKPSPNTPVAPATQPTNSQPGQHGQPAQYAQPAQYTQSGQYTQPGQYTQQGQPGQQPQYTTNPAKEAYITFKGILTQPQTTIRGVIAKNNLTSSLTLIGIKALATALFVTFMFSRINGMFADLFESIGALASIYGGGLLSGGMGMPDATLNNMFKFPILVIFIVSLLTSLALSAAFAGILMLLIKGLNKTNTTYYNMVDLVAIHSVGATTCTAVGIIVTIINPSWGLFIFALGSILGFGYLVQSLYEMQEINKNKVVILTFLGLVLITIIGFILIRITYSLYLPESLKDYSELLNGYL